MPIINALDLGPSHPWSAPQVGQVIDSALIAGSRTTVWQRGAMVEKQDVTLFITAWQAIGGQSAMTLGAARYLVKQLEELVGNPDLQPVYIQWTATAASGGYNVADYHDGWYVISDLRPDYRTYVVTGMVKAQLSVQLVATAAPTLSLASSPFGSLVTPYSATAAPLLAYPIGSTGQQATTSTRAGGEGSIPISTVALTGAVNPAPFVAPAVSALWTGGVRVWDTLNTASNPVPVAGGTYVHANWVEVYGTGHDFTGDLVVTNGLQLLLYVNGSAPAPLVYLWNTTLGTPTWQSIGSVQYQDNAGNAGTLRSYDLDRLGPQGARIRCRLNTSAGNWARLVQWIQPGHYETDVEFWPLSQVNTNQLGLAWNSTAVYVTGLTNATTSTTFPSNLATTSVSGYAAAQGSASGSPVFGWLYLTTPTTAQGRLSTSSVFGLGDTGGPVQGAMRSYAFFVVPYSGAVVTATTRGIVAPIFQNFLGAVETRWVRA